jgi:hypothetical protein
MITDNEMIESLKFAILKAEMSASLKAISQKLATQFSNGIPIANELNENIRKSFFNIPTGGKLNRAQRRANLTKFK